MSLKIGIVGLSFGARFIPLFKAHPLVSEVVIADLLPERLQYARDLYGALPSVSTLDELLASDVDAV
ncbi:MAG TPA: gfo/Idh/MocA family oxidoreductase, partial [Anaerolineae bacterium]|nr:gfo/Idh/MocA family oxidoreductase [Anaerolineae bacterium]